MTARIALIAAALCAAVSARGSERIYPLINPGSNGTISSAQESGNTLHSAPDSLPPVGISDAAPLAQQRFPAGGFSWSPTLSTGYDVYVQTYALSLEDTTETIADFDLSLAADGRSPADARHAWWIRPKLSAGSERNRASLEWSYDLKPDRRRSVLRIDGDLDAVWYDRGSDYYLTSDNVEGALRGRWILSPRGATALELRARGDWLRYADPSELEADRRDLYAGLVLKSGLDATRAWRIGLRAGRRAYPDSTEIDHDGVRLELEYDHNAFLAPTWRASHSSERRKAAEPAVRPSAWSHWTSVEASYPLGDAGLSLAADLSHEAWLYDAEWGAYSDQIRWDGDLGLAGGGLFGPAWQLGLAVETLDSGCEDESYAQIGARAGLDHMTDAFTGSLSLEIGRRDYDEPETVVGPGDVEETPLYTDFTYVEVWLMLSVDVTTRLRLDLMGSYLPENHGEEEDDQTLGFGTARVVYGF